MYSYIGHLGDAEFNILYISDHLVQTTGWLNLLCSCYISTFRVNYKLILIFAGFHHSHRLRILIGTVKTWGQETMVLCLGGGLQISTGQSWGLSLPPEALWQLSMSKKGDRKG